MCMVCFGIIWGMICFGSGCVVLVSILKCGGLEVGIFGQHVMSHLARLRSRYAHFENFLVCSFVVVCVRCCL